jgi:hypothetical protein
MRFIVGSNTVPEQQPVFALLKDNWNDWYKWYTMYAVTAIMPDGSRVELGSVKIGQKGMSETNGSSQLPTTFPALNSTY